MRPFLMVALKLWNLHLRSAIEKPDFGSRTEVSVDPFSIPAIAPVVRKRCSLGGVFHSDCGDTLTVSGHGVLARQLRIPVRH
jgi:hypothetical protein